jgi:hypothetical protein
MLPNLGTPSQKSSKPTSAGPSISEDFPKLANFGSSMSDEGMLLLADPSTMEVMAEHYVLNVPHAHSPMGPTIDWEASLGSDHTGICTHWLLDS